MNKYFNVTSIGYAHIESGKPCQDFSASYSDCRRTVITSCDGHGGEVYVRSDKGSRFASVAALRAMLDLESLSFHKYSAEEIEHKLKLSILCEWNKLVSRDLAIHPLRKKELSSLNEEQIKALKETPTKAYGTTLGAAMLLGNRLVCVTLGDGGCFLFKNGEISSPFPEDDDEPAANLTYSLCGEDAFAHMKARILDVGAWDGVLLCTDGVLGPYQSIENFKLSFVRPVVHRILEGDVDGVKSFVRELGASRGSGDDVSLAMIVKNDTGIKDYQ